MVVHIPHRRQRRVAAPMAAHPQRTSGTAGLLYVLEIADTRIRVSHKSSARRDTQTMRRL